MLGILSNILIAIGVVFFVGGVVGLLRFPDIYTRLHALTKADNIGLGFIIVGLMLQTAKLALIFKMILIWLLIILSSATICYLVSQTAQRMNISPWRKS